MGLLDACIGEICGWRSTGASSNHLKLEMGTVLLFASRHPFANPVAAATAILTFAIGVAAFFKQTTVPTVPAIADPVGVIPVPALQTAQAGHQNTITPTEPISIAILPLE